MYNSLENYNSTINSLDNQIINLVWKLLLRQINLLLNKSERKCPAPLPKKMCHKKYIKNGKYIDEK